MLPASFCLVNTIRLQFFLVYELDSGERERAVNRHHRRAREGRLVNRVATPTYALADIAAAHEAVERGTLGNVIVTL